MSTHDFLIRVKNASAAGKKSFSAPCSKVSRDIASLMQKFGYINSFDIDETTVKKIIKVNLAYDGINPKITNIKVISRPGARIYSSSSSLPWGKTKKSLIIISTSKGVISQKQARKLGVGGEVIAQVY